MLKKKMPVVQWVALLLIGALLLGCEGNSKIFVSTVEAAKFGTTAITLTANSAESPPIIEVGQTLTFTVKSSDKDGGQRTLNNQTDVTWSVDCTSPNCARIDPRNGSLIGVGDGEAKVTARYSGYSDSILVKVSSAKLTSITVSRVTDATIDYCRSYEVEAFGTYTDESGNEDTRDITGLATWGITPGGDILKDSNGKVTFSASVTTPVTVQATHKSMQGSQSFAVSDGIAPPSLIIEPQAMTRVYKGQSKQFTAEATWADGTTEEVTKNVSWRSSDAAMLDFSGNITSIDTRQRQDGLATGKAAGDVTITAACGAVAEATKNVTVAELTVTGIRIFRGNETVDSESLSSRYVLTIGSETTFRAEPVYAAGVVSDASQDITLDCDWSAIEPNSDAIAVGNSRYSTDAGKKKGEVTGMRSTNGDSAVFEVKYSPNGNSQEYFRETVEVEVQQ